MERTLHNTFFFFFVLTVRDKDRKHPQFYSLSLFQMPKKINEDKEEGEEGEGDKSG